MKTLSVILAASFLLLGSGLCAQTNPIHKDAAPNAGVPEVRKGYYSIGNNATKLKSKSSFGVTESETYPTVKKGYYSIGNNNRKLSKELLIEGSATSSVPIAAKGYYSIDRNKEKLKQ